MEQSQWQLTWDYYSSSLITPCSLSIVPDYLDSGGKFRLGTHCDTNWDVSANLGILHQKLNVEHFSSMYIGIYFTQVQVILANV